jgi:hypothetical protein
MRNNIKKFDQVILIENLPEHKLRKGDIGEVTFVCSEQQEFEIKFRDITGEVAALIRLVPRQIRKINTIHIRQVKKFNLN